MQNAGDHTVLPFPYFPSLIKYTRNTGDLLHRHPVDSFDLARSAQIMTRKGWVKDGEGFWARDGARFKIVIDVFAFMMDFAPVLVEQLRQRARSLLHAPALPQPVRAADRQPDTVFLALEQRGIRRHRR